MLIFGTRPEAIKMAPLVKALKEQSDLFETSVVVTGQHRELLDSVLTLFDIQPDYDLNIMKQGQDLYDITSLILLGLRNIFAENRPDLVMVHGDTTTSTAAALSAFYAQIPVAHVEAGLRTGDIYSPWPEEMNRRLTARLATFHFAPTAISAANLKAENTPEENICITGNTVIDALRLVSDKIETDRATHQPIRAEIASLGYDTSRLTNGGRRLVLITGHRRENFGEGFMNICSAIQTLATQYPDIDFVYPMHLNPNVRKPIARMFEGKHYSNVFFIEPIDYLPFVYMMKMSYLIITDSGGIQEEAPSMGKPVLVMRNVTERPEALQAGTIRLVGTDHDKIVAEATRFIDDEKYYAANQRIANPYGDGQACRRIIDFLSQKL